jgi:hypothetical protein
LPSAVSTAQRSLPRVQLLKLSPGLFECEFGCLTPPLLLLAPASLLLEC